MKILIFTCLCQRATHRRNVALHPLQMLPVLPAAHNEGKDVFLQLKRHGKVLHVPLLGRGGGVGLKGEGRRHLDDDIDKTLFHWTRDNVISIRFLC